MARRSTEDYSHSLKLNFGPQKQKKLYVSHSSPRADMIKPRLRRHGWKPFPRSHLFSSHLHSFPALLFSFGTSFLSSLSCSPRSSTNAISYQSIFRLKWISSYERAVYLGTAECYMILFVFAVPGCCSLFLRFSVEDLCSNENVVEFLLRIACYMSASRSTLCIFRERGLLKKSFQTTKVIKQKTDAKPDSIFPYSNLYSCFDVQSWKYFFAYTASFPLPGFRHFKSVFYSQCPEDFPFISCVYQKELQSTDLSRDYWHRLSLFFLSFCRHACYLQEGRLWFRRRLTSILVVDLFRGTIESTGELLIGSNIIDTATFEVRMAQLSRYIIYRIEKKFSLRCWFYTFRYNKTKVVYSLQARFHGQALN